MTTTGTIAPSFTRGKLGRTGREVFRLGLAASYGIGAAGTEEAIERGVNYLYWGSFRTRAFGEAIRNACARGKRERLVLVIQSYTRLGMLMGPSLCRALHKLKLDYADVLLLGWWQSRPPDRIVDAALRLKERGLVRHLALSTHERPLIPKLAAPGPFDIFHVRYNAAHRGAEREVLGELQDAPAERPGVVAFTATRWGTLLDPVPGAPPDARVPTAGDCYRFALTNPKIDVAICGAADVAQLRHALDALERGPLDPDELQWIRAHGDRLHAWARQSPLSFRYWRGPAAT